MPENQTIVPREGSYRYLRALVDSVEDEAPVLTPEEEAGIEAALE